VAAMIAANSLRPRSAGLCLDRYRGAYFAVRQPSNVVVLENVVLADTKGTSEGVNAKYELMERGGYLPTGYQFDPVVLNANCRLSFTKHGMHCALRNRKARNSMPATAISTPSS